MKKIIPQSVKNIYHLFQAIWANVWYGFPSRKMKVIGVTGTNGKTTTVQMIAKILEEAGKKIAVASTINFKIGEREWVNATKFTTLSSWRLQKHLREAARAGCEFAIVEATSHSLDQNRVWGIDFDVAVITNVTREHLDYHETMEEYARAKEKLFAGLEKSGRSGKSAAVVNLGMEFAEEFLGYPAGEKYGYCLENQKSTLPTGRQEIKNQKDNAKIKIIEAKNIELGIENTRYQILGTSFQINLPGEFNIENALAATCVGLSQNIPLEKISAALAKIKKIPGRMERIENNRGIEIIVDYAVTPDSLEKLYNYLKEVRLSSHSFVPSGHLLAAASRGGGERKIIAVFGSCGERDRGKRPIMGEIVAKAADIVIVTNEDPYNENPMKIVDEVFNGVINPKSEAPNPKQIQNLKFKIQNSAKREGVNAFRILDRREAIKKALQIAKPGDTVVVTGKGAEETMATGAQRIPWNDPRVIREILSERATEKNR